MQCGSSTAGIPWCGCQTETSSINPSTRTSHFWTLVWYKRVAATENLKRVTLTSCPWKQSPDLINVVFMYIVIRMSMVMKIMDFLFSVDQGYVYAMLSMMAFGWELVIIENEINSSGGMSLRGNSRSLFFWNFTCDHDSNLKSIDEIKDTWSSF